MIDGCYLGIDPGFHGAIAVLRVDGNRVEVVNVFDPPVVQITTGKKTAKGNKQHKTQYVPGSMVDLLCGIVEKAAGAEVHVTIEKTWAMARPGKGTQGVTSMFNIGYGYGLWKGIIAALGIPYEEVPPNTWKLAMVGRVPADEEDSKSRSIIRAQELFPAAVPFLKRKKDDGRAEAILIAEWGRRHAGGEPAKPVQIWTNPVVEQVSMFGEF